MPTFWIVLAALAGFAVLLWLITREARRLTERRRRWWQKKKKSRSEDGDLPGAGGPAGDAWLAGDPTEGGHFGHGHPGDLGDSGHGH
jgi:hypothetical protein